MLNRGTKPRRPVPKVRPVPLTPTTLGLGTSPASALGHSAARDMQPLVVPKLLSLFYSGHFLGQALPLGCPEGSEPHARLQLHLFNRSTLQLPVSEATSVTGNLCK
jgi:hypothetical protein